MHWLFLRGLAREQRHWGSFPEIFARHVPGSRVHCLDLPGAGSERGRASPITIRGIAGDVRERWLALRDEHVGSWGLLGVSLGGMVAMAWCAEHPEDFARLVLAGSSTSDLSRPWRRFDLQIVPTALRSLAESDPLRREEKILAITTRLLADRAAVAAEWARYPPMTRGNVARQLYAARAFRAPERVDVPALVVVGDRDPLADPSCSRLLASHLGVPLAVHPGAGHELSLDAPDWFAAAVATWLATPRRAEPGDRGEVRVEPLRGASTAGLPLLIEPAPGADRGEAALRRFVGAHRAYLEERLTEHGAILLRGFDVEGAPGFERVARAFEPALRHEHLGSSPGERLAPHVFSVNEPPGHYPVPACCETGFPARPPRRLFFCCLVPSSGPGGETPLADFRRVVRALPADVRARFEARGVRTIRRYAAPRGGLRGNLRFDPWRPTGWDALFGTDDRAAVARACQEHGVELTWKADGGLRVVAVQPAVKRHPVTGEPVWFNQSQIFHLSTVPAEYRRIAARQGQLRYAALARVAEAAVQIEQRTTDVEDRAMHCTYGDGTPILDEDMERVRDAIWESTVFFKWRRGDVLMVDNDAVAHGRMPYAGPRVIAVAWA